MNALMHPGSNYQRTGKPVFSEFKRGHSGDVSWRCMTMYTCFHYLDRLLEKGLQTPGKDSPEELSTTIRQLPGSRVPDLMDVDLKYVHQHKEVLSHFGLNCLFLDRIVGTIVENNSAHE